VLKEIFSQVVLLLVENGLINLKQSVAKRMNSWANKSTFFLKLPIMAEQPWEAD
jgi:hypothetical protein